MPHHDFTREWYQFSDIWTISKHPHMAPKLIHMLIVASESTHSQDRDCTWTKTTDWFFIAQSKVDAGKIQSAAHKLLGQEYILSSVKMNVFVKRRQEDRAYLQSPVRSWTSSSSAWTGSFYSACRFLIAKLWNLAWKFILQRFSKLPGTACRGEGRGAWFRFNLALLLIQESFYGGSMNVDLGCYLDGLI